MKRTITLSLLFTLATLLAGCELYNRNNNQPPVVHEEYEIEAKYLIGDYYGDIYDNGLGN